MDAFVNPEVLNAGSSFLSSLKELVMAAPIVGRILLLLIILGIRKAIVRLLRPDMPFKIRKDLFKKLK